MCIPRFAIPVVAMVQVCLIDVVAAPIYIPVTIPIPSPSSPHLGPPLGALYIVWVLGIMCASSV